MLIASTAQVAANERVAYWESWNQSSLVGLRCSTPTPEGFSATSMQHEVGSSAVTRIAASRHYVDRTAQGIASAPKSSVFVSTLLVGSAFIYHEGGLQAVRPGDTLIYSNERPYLLGFDQDMELLIVDLDGPTVFDDWGRDLGTGPVLSARRGSTARIVETALRVLELGGGRRAEGDPTGLAPRGTGAGQGGTELLEYCRQLLMREDETEILYRRALEHIRAGLSDPEFDVPSLAERVHVSERQLRRVFEANGTSPGSELLDARLHRARQTLLESAESAVGTVASACGFGSASAFARAYRARFGHSPSEDRAARP